MRRVQVEAITAPDVRPPSPRRGAPARGLLELQRTAGNRAVTAMMAATVQRCGSIPPDECSCHRTGSAPLLQRDIEPGGDPAAPPAGSSGPPTHPDLGAKLRGVAADLRALQAFGMARAAADGLSEIAGPELAQLGGVAAQVEATAGSSDEALKSAVLNSFGPAFVAGAEAMAQSKAAEQGENIEGVQPQHESIAQRFAAMSAPSGAAAASASVQRQVAETLVLVGGGMVGTAEAAAPVEAATGPPGWIVGATLLVVGAVLVGVGVYMASPGNVADTGIMEEARELVRSGRAADICAALALLMAATTDSQRKLKIKATQKAMGCRHSRQS